MQWFREWRVLVVAYALATLVAIREVVVSRTEGPVAWPSDEWTEMVEVVRAINPDEPDTRWLESMEARRAEDPEGFVLGLEESLASDIKHNEFLLQDYTQLMLDRGADYRIVNWAANRWRENHPFSSNTLRMEIASGIASEEDEALLRAELAEIRWLHAVEIVPAAEGGEAGRWQLLLDFHPAHEIDIRDAVEAVTLLTLTPQQRAGFRVSCQTLEDCRLLPR